MPLKSLLSCSAALALALPLQAEESRALGAHEHGRGALNIAIEGNSLAIELEAPGFDIVGFEHAATSEKDKALVEAALATLGAPEKLVTLPDAAGCTVTVAAAELLTEAEGHEDHDHEDAQGHGGEDSADHDDHDTQDHEGDDHDDQGDEDQADHDGHDEHHHDDHAEHADHPGETSHSEFHAEYLLNCSDIAALTRIDLPYFSAFENAGELEVQLVTDKGAFLLEATPENATLDLTKAM